MRFCASALYRWVDGRKGHYVAFPLFLVFGTIEVDVVEQALGTGEGSFTRACVARSVHDLSPIG